MAARKKKKPAAAPALDVPDDDFSSGSEWDQEGEDDHRIAVSVNGERRVVDMWLTKDRARELAHALSAVGIPARVMERIAMEPITRGR